MGIKEIEICGRTLTIHEHDDTNDSATGRALTGSWLWDSALHLANWMQAQILAHFDLAGKTILELGAGTGLPGITAAILGVDRVILTDIAPILLGLRRNVEANGLELGRGVEIRELIWGSSDDEGEGELLVDLVLMSDLFYDAEEMEGLGRTLRGVCGEKMRVWAASEVRGSTGECLEVLAKEGIEVEEVKVSTGQLMGCADQESSQFAVYVMRCNEIVRNGEKGSRLFDGDFPGWVGEEEEEDWELRWMAEIEN